MAHPGRELTASTTLQPGRRHRHDPAARAGWAGQLLQAYGSGNYRAPLAVPQGRLLAVYGVDVALRQRLLRDRAALTLCVFDKRRQHTQLAAERLAADSQTKYETRAGYLGFTWFLGTNKPAGTIENQPKGDAGGFGW